MGVAKLVDAAKVMAIRNGLGSTSIARANEIAIGAITIAVAILDNPSVIIAVIR